ncbi:MAG: hypothetical protein NVSMB29_01350 [Candidatus Dormibacteria bacterium]
METDDMLVAAGIEVDKFGPLRSRTSKGPVAGLGFHDAGPPAHVPLRAWGPDDVSRLGPEADFYIFHSRPVSRTGAGPRGARG